MYIPEDKIIELTRLSAFDITLIIQENYPEDKFHNAEFCGMNVYGRFVYDCFYREDGETCHAKVYVVYDPIMCKFCADY